MRAHSGPEKFRVSRGRGRNCRTRFAEDTEGGRRRRLLTIWAKFPAAAEPVLQPSLRAAALLPRTPAREAGSHAGALAWRCRALPAPPHSVPREGGVAVGGCSGTRALSQNPALSQLGGAQMGFHSRGQGRRARAEPCLLQSSQIIPAPLMLQPPSQWKAGNFTCPCPSCSSF